VAGRYVRAQLHEEPGFEVLLVRWAAGAASPVHGHDGQRCWVRPLAGVFELEDYALLSGGRAPGPAHVVAAGAREVSPDDVDHKDDDDELHAVRLASGQRAGLSLHVYARPVRTALIFDVEGRRCSRRPVRADLSLPLVNQEPTHP
jgi:NitT/TauT family transport system ATP-binding protein